MKEIKIIDCTLREGNQARQCYFTHRQSVSIARELASIGVDMIECGHPIISPYEFVRTKLVVEIEDIK